MQQSNDTTSINNSERIPRLLIACVCVVTFFAGCKLDPKDPDSQRTRLGTMQLAFVASFINTTDFQFGGRLRSYDTRDSSYSETGIGSFKHFFSIRDTTSTDSIRVYYTLPQNLQFHIDTASRRFVLIYKQSESRFALILKTKNDSLVAMISRLLPNELDPVQAKDGAQSFRVARGNNVYLARNTECGREGDYDMVFSINDGSVAVAPARSGQLLSAEKLYSLYNVVNTQIIKDLNSCAGFVPEFAFMIIKQ